MPNWLRNVIPRVGETHTHFNLMSDAYQGSVILTPDLTVSKGNIGTRQLFMVCHSCNTGWMRDLQDEIIPVLTPLIKGRWGEFDRLQGSRIAVWMAMTTAVIALSYRKTSGVPFATRRFIRNELAVPPHWSMWVGRGTGFEDIRYHNRVALMSHPSQGFIYGREPNTAVTTIALGQLILHAISLPDDAMKPDATVYGQEMGLFPIHPWGGDALDWRWIPVIPAGSPQFSQVVDWYYLNIMLAGRDPASI